MSEILKPGEDRITLLENQIRGVVTHVNQLAGIVGLLDTYLVMNKKFFDQIKLNEPPKEEKKEEKKEDK